MMKTILVLSLTLLCSAAYAQEEGYKDYDQGMRVEKTKMPVNVGHQVGSALSKAKRQMNGQLAGLNSDSFGSQSTQVNGRDVFNVGGLVVGDTPIQANNIIIVSRPGGANGMEGPLERQIPHRR
jgi:hypothetical protein